MPSPLYLVPPDLSDALAAFLHRGKVLRLWDKEEDNPVGFERSDLNCPQARENLVSLLADHLLCGYFYEELEDQYRMSRVKGARQFVEAEVLDGASPLSCRSSWFQPDVGVEKGKLPSPPRKLKTP